MNPGLMAAPGRPAPGLALGRSVLARRIVIVNLAGLLIVVAGALSVTYLREGLVQQRERALSQTVQLLATMLAEWPPEAAAGMAGRIALPEGALLGLFDARGRLLGPDGHPVHRAEGGSRRPALPLVAAVLDEALAGAASVVTGPGPEGGTVFVTAAPVRRGGEVQGAVALASGAGEIDALAGQERGRLLRLILVAALVSLGLSLVLASAIATPLARLVAAAEAGRGSGRRGAARVRIPDLGDRRDEIGRLSGALRNMVAALYQRLEANEQFAADVAHELKNPLASLRSAVSTMRIMTREEQREKLLAIIEHDVRRLDRLVSDIANASRLDSELVREEEEEFDIARMLRRIADHFRDVGAERGIALEADLPPGPLRLRGLEPRLAQVFVNLLANALSFCAAGDAVRLWCRGHEGRVMVVVEDTGPGIPPESLDRIFRRFYSERPASQFGEHSGLGLAISRQIVEAHGGTIWAENVEDAAGGPGAPPLGARFVVGLPV